MEGIGRVANGSVSLCRPPPTHPPIPPSCYPGAEMNEMAAKRRSFPSLSHRSRPEVDSRSDDSLITEDTGAHRSFSLPFPLPRQCVHRAMILRSSWKILGREADRASYDYYDYSCRFTYRQRSCASGTLSWCNFFPPRLHGTFVRFYAPSRELDTRERQYFIFTIAGSTPASNGGRAIITISLGDDVALALGTAAGIFVNR